MPSIGCLSHFVIVLRPRSSPPAYWNTISLNDTSKIKSDFEELVSTKDNVNSKEFIEQMAREKLDMYLPNERVYIDISK